MKKIVILVHFYSFCIFFSFQIVVATSTPHQVASGATGAAGLTRHIVMTHSGGTPVRSGQILQVNIVIICHDDKGYEGE